MTKVHYKEQPSKQQLSRWQNQEKILFSFFHKEPATMYQAEKATSINRGNICRFVASWKKAGTIKVVRVGKDPFTKCQAQFLSTNPAHWPAPPKPLVSPSGKSAQLDMFQ